MQVEGGHAGPLATNRGRRAGGDCGIWRSGFPEVDPQPAEGDPESSSPTADPEPQAVVEVLPTNPPDSSDTATLRLRLSSEQQKTARRLLKKLRQESLPRLEKYEQQQAICGDRHSFSQTIPTPLSCE